jgi:HEAT repeats
VSNGQLDLFSGSGFPPAGSVPAAAKPVGLAPADLDDAALLAAIPATGRADGPPLAAEAGRRRLGAAIPVLEDYCRRFAGFGVQHALPEQVAALEALAAIGGQEAARSVARIIGRGWVQGPTLAIAVTAAARLRSQLPAEVAAVLLRHADPAIRGDACRLARPGPEVTATLVDLLGDLNRDVSVEAACALGRMGRPESVPQLKHALRLAPSLRVIEAVAAVADEECVVLLGRLARTRISPQRRAMPSRRWSTRLPRGFSNECDRGEAGGFRNNHRAPGFNRVPAFRGMTTEA